MKTNRKTIWTTVALVGVIVILGTIYLMDRNIAKAPDQQDYDLSSADKSALTDVTKTFISEDGTFGVYWDSVPDDQDLESIHDAWIVANATDDDLPDDVSGMLATRGSVLYKLLQKRSDDSLSLLSTDSAMAKYGKNELNVLSDSTMMSGFTTNADDVTINWGKSHAVKTRSAVEASIDVSWSTRWIRSTKTPDAYENTKRSDWDVQSKSVDLKDVTVTLVRSQDGKQWQVTNVSGGNLSDKGFVLATAGDISYNVDGSITGYHVNRNQSNADGS
jgi:hypothetical protein